MKPTGWCCSTACRRPGSTGCCRWTVPSTSMPMYRAFAPTASPSPSKCWRRRMWRRRPASISIRSTAAASCASATPARPRTCTRRWRGSANGWRHGRDDPARALEHFSGKCPPGAWACTHLQKSIARPREYVRGAGRFTPSPRVPSGRLRPSSTGYGEGGVRGPLHELRLAEAPPHRAEFWFSSLPSGPYHSPSQTGVNALMARGARCAVPAANTNKRCVHALVLSQGRRSVASYSATAPASNHLHRDRAQEIALADLHAAVTQDRVGGGQMEIDVRQHEMVEIIVAFHLALIGRAERKGDLTIGCGIDLLGIEGLEKGHGPCEPGLELIDGRLVVLETGRLDAGQPRHAV